jgi:4-cresol dehydrogenase (hydroxylating)
MRLAAGATFHQLRVELARLGDKLMLRSYVPPVGGVLGNGLDRGAGYTPYFDHFGILVGQGSCYPTAKCCTKCCTRK